MDHFLDDELSWRGNSLLVFEMTFLPTRQFDWNILFLVMLLEYNLKVYNIGFSDVFLLFIRR